MYFEPWHIQLLGGLQARQGERVLTRFPAGKAGPLLAYLVYFSEHAHPREELVELLWPEADPEASRASLRVALSSLRRQLEPPGAPAGSVLIADRVTVRLNPEAVRTDVADFLVALQVASQSGGPVEKARRLQEAVGQYRGDLLTGYYEDWMLQERERLAQRYQEALSELVQCLEQTGEIEQAIDIARRAVQGDTLNEARYADVIRLYIRAGRPEDALRQYQELERLLQEELGERPSPTIRQLAEPLQADVAGRVSLSARSSRTQGGTKPPSSSPAGIRLPAMSVTSPPPGPRLPMSFLRFFGRQTEIESLERWLRQDDIRLLTLTGPGGSGKTRLAIEIAHRLQPAFAGAVCFVSLADLRDAAHIPRAIADALELPLSGSVIALEQVAPALNVRPWLLVLDNCEHLVDQGAAMIRQLLEAVPSLVCLATSRQALGLEVEQEFPLSPLPTPNSAGTPERLLEFASVQLFVDRAQKARPDFQITPHNAGDLAALCQGLEGIPLAIELAAAWARTLTVGQMRERLAHRFDLLVSRHKDTVTRHHTLRAAIEWSFQLLDPEIQQFFVRLSVFRGGWTLEAAESVCGGRNLKASPSSSCLDLLTQLQERSLITAQETAEGMRYRMLETLREYADEQLRPAERQDVLRRHAYYFLALAEQAEPQMEGPEIVRWLDRLEMEHDNLRATLQWCKSGEPSEKRAEIGLRLACRLVTMWQHRNYAEEGWQHFQDLLARAQGYCEPVVYAEGLYKAAALAMRTDRVDTAQASLEEALSFYRSLGDQRGIADCLAALSHILSDKTESRALTEQSLAIYRALNLPDRVGRCLFLRGWRAANDNDWATAREEMTQALALHRQVNNRDRIAFTLTQLGFVTCRQHDYEAARAFLEESWQLGKGINKGGDVWVMGMLGNVLRIQEDYAVAQSCLEQALSIARETGEPHLVAGSLTDVALLRIAQGDLASARTCLEEATRLWSQPAFPEGMGAYVMEGWRSLAIQEAQWTRAAMLQGATARLRQQENTLINWQLEESYPAETEVLRSVLGEPAFQMAWEAGQQMTLEQAAAYVLADSA